MTEMEDVFKQQIQVPSYVINITAQNITQSDILTNITELSDSNKQQVGKPKDVQDVKL